MQHLKNSTCAPAEIDDWGKDLRSKLIKFIDAYTEEITQKKINDASVFYIAVSMACDLILKIEEVREKDSVFSKAVIEGLLSVPIFDEQGKHIDNVNIIDIICSFLEICSKFNDAEFKRYTIESYYGKAGKDKFNINYHLTYAENEFTIGDCKNRFIVLFKVFRTLVGRIIKTCTGSYEIPEARDWRLWSYNIFDGTSFEKKNLSDLEGQHRDDFYSFIEEISNIYTELEKLPKNLSCISNVFASAKADAAGHQEQKKIKYRSHPRKSNKHIQGQKIQQNVPHIMELPDPPAAYVIRSTISWGGYNPITCKAIL